MGERHVPAHYRGIVKPDETLTWWEAESGFFDGGGVKQSDIQEVTPVTGGATPQDGVVTDMGLRAGGGQEEDLVAQCNRGGLPGLDAAGVLFKLDGQAASLFRGRDLPPPAAACLFLELSAARYFPHAVTTPTDHVVLCWQDIAGNTYSRTLNPDTLTWGAEVTVDSGAYTNGYPCLIVIPRETGYRLMLYRWASGSGGGHQVRAWHSDDNGATWEAEGPVLLAEVDSTTYPTHYRLRGVYVAERGQVALFGHLLAVDTAADIERDRVIQWASSDGGTQLTQVELSDGSDTDHAGAWIDVCLWRGEIVLGRLVYDAVSATVVPVFRRLSTAWYPWTSGEDESAPGSGAAGLPSAQNWGVYVPGGGAADQYIPEGELALWCSEEQALFAAGRHCAGGDDGACPIIRSPDGADSWTIMGKHPTYPAAANDGSCWWNTGGPGPVVASPNNEPLSFCGVYQRGRGIMITSWRRAGGAYLGYMAAIFLGGWTTVPMPTQGQLLASDARCAWDYNGCGMHLPSEGPWTQVLAGGATEVLTSGRVVATGAAGSVRNHFSPTTTVAQGYVAEWSLEVNSGTAQCEMRLSDATPIHYEVEVRVTSTTVQLWDSIAGTQIGSTLTHGHKRLRILLGMRGSTVICYCRGDDTVAALGFQEALTAPDREWEEVAGTLTLSNAPANPGSRVQFRTLTAAVVYWDEWPVSAGKYTGTGIMDQALREKYPGPVVDLPCYLGHGVRVSAVSGPAMYGDAWDIEASAEYPVEAMLPFVDASRRRPHRAGSLAVANGSYRWSWERAITVEYAMSLRWAAFVDLLNFGGASLHLYYGGVWDAGISLGYWEFTADRYGTTLVVNSGGLPNSGVFRRDELVGCLVEYITGGNVVASYRVVENTPGHTATTVGTSLPVALRVDGGDPADPAQPTVRIYPNRALVIFDLEALSTEIRGVQLRATHNNALGNATPPQPPPEGYFEIPMLAPGPLWAWGWSPSHGRRLGLAQDVEITEAEDGTDIPYVRQPPRRMLEWTWATGVPTGPHVESNDPDYIAAKTGGSPLAFKFDAPLEVQDQLRALQGAATVVIVCERIDQAGSGGKLQWAHGAFPARLTGTADLDNVRGAESYDEMARIQGISWREVT